MPGYDVTRLEPAGVVVTHHHGKIETDGPWLVIYQTGDRAAIADLIAPAHVIVSVTPCDYPGTTSCKVPADG